MGGVSTYPEEEDWVAAGEGVTVAEVKTRTDEETFEADTPAPVAKGVGAGDEDDCATVRGAVGVEEADGTVVEDSDEERVVVTDDDVGVDGVEVGVGARDGEAGEEGWMGDEEGEGEEEEGRREREGRGREGREGAGVDKEREAIEGRTDQSKPGKTSATGQRVT